MPRDGLREAIWWWMGGILLGEVFWKQILHKSIINYSQPVLIGRPTLDIEDGLADCL